MVELFDFKHLYDATPPGNRDEQTASEQLGGDWTRVEYQLVRSKGEVKVCVLTLSCPLVDKPLNMYVGSDDLV